MLAHASLEAALALLEQPGFQSRIEDTTRALIDGLVAEAKKANVAFSAQCVGSMFGLYFRASAPTSYAEVMQCDALAFNRFFHAMLDSGIYLAPSAFEAGFVSAAHGDAEIDETVAAARMYFLSLPARSA